MNEIIPIGQLHFRTPVLDDLIHHQHKALMHSMTTNQDQWNEEQRWTTTALSFASKLHPPKDKSFWAAARRALIIFDWIGHGRNRAKQCSLHPAQIATTEKCPHCSQLDDQAHCMLECPHIPFHALRQTAEIDQAVIALDLTHKHSRDQNLIHFIQQICYASWTRSPNLSRIWLGTWSMHTLQQLLGQPTDEPMTMNQRHTYIDIAKQLFQLTASLLNVYSAMIDICTVLPTFALTPSTLHTAGSRPTSTSGSFTTRHSHGGGHHEPLPP
jgi:hypothetical protein